MAHIEVVNGKEKLVPSTNKKVKMRLEDPEGTMAIIENSAKDKSIKSE
jgi:hypothetical protein